MTLSREDGIWYVDDSLGGLVELKTVLEDQEQLISHAVKPGERAARRGFVQLLVIGSGIPDAERDATYIDLTREVQDADLQSRQRLVAARQAKPFLHATEALQIVLGPSFIDQKLEEQLADYLADGGPEPERLGADVLADFLCKHGLQTGVFQQRETLPGLTRTQGMLQLLEQSGSSQAVLWTAAYPYVMAVRNSAGTWMAHLPAQATSDPNRWVALHHVLERQEEEVFAKIQDGSHAAKTRGFGQVLVISAPPTAIAPEPLAANRRGLPQAQPAHVLQPPGSAQGTRLIDLTQEDQDDATARKAQPFVRPPDTRGAVAARRRSIAGPRGASSAGQADGRALRTATTGTLPAARVQ